MNTHRPPDSVMDLLRKVKALADAGAPGEREAARARLDALLNKHGITEEQLNESEGKLHGFTYKGLQDQLLVMVIVAHVSNGRKVAPQDHGDGKRNKMWVKLTAAQFIDVETQLDFYRKHWNEELQIFFRAFISAQNLGLARDEDEAPPRIETDKDLWEQRRIAGMKMFILERSPRRQLAAPRR